MKFFRRGKTTNRWKLRKYSNVFGIWGFEVWQRNVEARVRGSCQHFCAFFFTFTFTFTYTECEVCVKFAGLSTFLLRMRKRNSMLNLIEFCRVLQGIGLFYYNLVFGPWHRAACVDPKPCWPLSTYRDKLSLFIIC